MLQFISNPMFAWPLVIIATIVETIWFVLLKKSGGLEVWPYNLLSVFIVLIDIPLLAIALKTIPSGSVYAFWTGVSAVAIALIGIYFFNEPATFWRLFFIIVAVIGVVGLQINS
jgi:quaternary ammonium compound-resistance protein SugE